MNTTRTINLRQFLKDLRDGQRHPALRDKHGLTDAQYVSVLQEGLYRALTKAPGTGLHGLPLQWNGTCSEVLDGDTITVWWRDCPVTIRLYGIDAPEKRQPGYVEAFEALKALVHEKEVGVKLMKGVFDPGGPGRTGKEKYSRVLASVVCPPFPDVGMEMIRQGMAYYYEKRTLANPEYDHQLREAFERARAAQVGLWRVSPDFQTPPWEYRKKRGS